MGEITYDNIFSEFKQWIMPMPRYRGIPLLSSTYNQLERWEYIYSSQGSMVFKHKTKDMPYLHILEADIERLVKERQIFPAIFDNVRLGIYEQMEKKK